MPPRLPEELERRGIPHCDYILSGIPFSILEIEKKLALPAKTYEALRRGGHFIIYQVTNELSQHANPVRACGVGVFSPEHSPDVHHGFR